MRGLSLIGSLALSLLPLFAVHADQRDLPECACLCALNCKGIVCEVPLCEVLAWGNCTPEATQECANDCCPAPEPPPVVFQ